MRAPSRARSVWLLWVVLAMVGLAGCGGSSSAGSAEEYPLVEQEPPKWQPPKKMPGGSVVQLPALPTIYEADPSPTCERQLATFHDGSEPSRRPVVIPPRPGLKAIAITRRRVRLEWSFRNLPADCRPVAVRLSVRNGSEPRAPPTTTSVRVDDVSGAAETLYPEFLPAPNVASASAYSKGGRRSRTVSVLIRRPGNLPPEIEPPPRLAAPVGGPVSCVDEPRVVSDPLGDILTHQPGSAPAPVGHMTAKLSRIDIARAAVQIDNRTLCAQFTFAQAPVDIDFRLTLTLRDASTSSCCASLRVRRSRGRFEVGYEAYSRERGLHVRPVRDGGAKLTGNKLIISGTLPPPSAWPLQSHRMPTAENLGWSVTTGYSAHEYGPHFGDSLPRHEEINQPLVRHRDGETVRPGATG